LFQRFTDGARHVVVLAQEEARLLGHNHVGTEHILLGLIHEEEGVACQVLESLGISLQGAREHIEEIIGQGQAAPPVHMPFTPRAKKVLELSLRSAFELGRDYIGTEHILLGLVREGEGVAAQVLQKLGTDLNRIRSQVIALSPAQTRLEGSPVFEGSDPEEQSRVARQISGLLDPKLQARNAAHRARRARELAARLAAVSGDPAVTSADVFYGLMMNEARLRSLEVLAAGLEEPPPTELPDGPETQEGTGEQT
jgi:ATP-dependent Clp protease ATP-binding subunit ClpC